jgi:hypothetical protein
MDNGGVAVLSQRQYEASPMELPQLESGLNEVVTWKLSAPDVFMGSHFLDEVAPPLRELSHYLSLQHDWNGEGADAPTEAAVNVARNVVVGFARSGVVPRVMALDDGGILVEVRIARAIAQIEILATGGIEFNFSARGKVYYEGKGRPNEFAVLHYLADLAKTQLD